MNEDTVFSRDGKMAVLHGVKLSAVPAPDPGLCHGCRAYEGHILFWGGCPGHCQDHWHADMPGGIVWKEIK